MKTRTLIGEIFEKKLDEKESYTKWSFAVKTTNGKTITLGLFIGNKDKEEIRLKKEALSKDFKKGDTAQFEFYDKSDGNVVYHNIVDINDVDEKDQLGETDSDVPTGGFTKPIDEDELKKSKEKYNIKNIDEPIFEEKTSKSLSFAWKSRCISFKGSMDEIANKINEINKNNDTFVVATHQPTRIDNSQNNYCYETIIFYKERVWTKNDTNNN